jgi:hypothetical protein
MRARMRQPPARPTSPFTAPPTERLARAPVKAAPRASLPLTARSPEGSELPDLEDAAVGTVDRFPPLARQAGGRTPRGARPRPPLPGRRPHEWLSPPALIEPVLREERVCGGSPCRQVDRLSWAFVPRRTDSPVRAIVGAWLIRPSDRSPTDASPGVRRPVTRTPRSAPHHSRLAP